MTVAQAAGQAPQAAVAETAAPPAADEARLKALYSVMQSIENKLGGGEGVEGLYGSIKKSGMDKVLACMRHHCGLDARSVLVDVGAGLGRPLMHALLYPGIAGAQGIEIDRIKCDKAHAFLRQAVAELARRGVLREGQLEPPEIQCSPIEEVCSLDPCTHAYSFWEGVPVEGKAAFGRLFAASRTLQSVAVVQRAIRTCPLEYMADLGFGDLELVGSFSVSMSGSGRSFTAYVFNKAEQPAALPQPLAVEAAAAASVETPAQAGEAAGAALSEGTVALPAGGDGEEAVHSRPRAAGAAAATEGTGDAVPGRGRRQRKPSARQQAAEEAEQALAALPAPGAAAGRRQQPRSARAQRAERRASSVWESAQLASQVAAAEQQQAQQQAAAPPAAALPSPRRPSRSVSRPSGGSAAAAKPTAPPAAKLSSPQKGGVQKRSSPVKAGGAGGALPPAVRRASPRKLALSGGAAAPNSKAAAAAEDLQLPVLVSRSALLQHSRVTKGSAGSAAAATAKQQQAATAATRQSARRGLQASMGTAQ